MWQAAMSRRCSVFNPDRANWKLRNEAPHVAEQSSLCESPSEIAHHRRIIVSWPAERSVYHCRDILIVVTIKSVSSECSSFAGFLRSARSSEVLGPDNLRETRAILFSSSIRESRLVTCVYQGSVHQGLAPGWHRKDSKTSHGISNDVRFTRLRHEK